MSHTRIILVKNKKRNIVFKEGETVGQLLDYCRKEYQLPEDLHFNVLDQDGAIMRIDEEVLKIKGRLRIVFDPAVKVVRAAAPQPA